MDDLNAQQWELRRLSEELAALRTQEAKKPSTAWMLPALFAALLTGAVGYVGIVHQIVLRHTVKIDTINEIQQRNMHVIDEMDDLKRRMVVNEHIVQQIPWLTRQIQDISVKLDRVLERTHTH